MTCIDFLMFLLVLIITLTFVVFFYTFKFFIVDNSDINTENFYSTHTVVNKNGEPSSLSNEEGISMIYTALSEIKDKLDNL